MITSQQNPLVKRIKRLKQKKYRREEGAFFAEGLRVALAAVESGAPVEALIWSPELLTSETARQVVAEQQAAGVAVTEVARPVYEALSERDNPTGLGAIVHERWASLEELPIDEESIYVSLVGAADPGNLGTVLRTIDAVGASGLILAGDTVDPFHPTAVKASMGSLFTVPLSQAASVEALLHWATLRGLQTVATSAWAASSFWEAEYAFPLLLLLGREGEGLPAAVLAAADLAVSIPMQGNVTSLNVAVAAGLMLYELRRVAGIEGHRLH